MVFSRDATATTMAAEKSTQTANRPISSNGGDDMTSAPTTKTAPIPIANANSTSTATTATAISSSSPLSVSSASSITQNAPMSSSRKSRERRKGTVHLEDLPGTRVGPDDGPWPKTYEILEDEEDVWKELRLLARPHRAVFVNENDISDDPIEPKENGSGGDHRAQSEPPKARVTLIDSINFQPCRTLKTQDRYVVTQLDVHGESWTLAGVFDGHMGDVTVEHVAHHLPIIIRDFLKKDLPSPSEGSGYDPQRVSQLFQSAISAFDDAIAHDVLDLFGGSIDKLDQYSDAEIRSTINDSPRGTQSGGFAGGNPGKFGDNWRKARLCMYGTTALVALVDPKGEGLWVANLGDCMGLLVTHTVPVDSDSDESDADGSPEPASLDDGEWTVDVLTTMHNGDNDDEIKRIIGEHPGEEGTAVVDRRVLGALAPTRCLGDIPFKQPPDFTRRILYNLYPFVHNTAPWEEFLAKNKTPPYISAEAEVVYRSLGKHEEPSDEAATPLARPPSSRRPSRLSTVLKLEKLASGLKKKGKKDGRSTRKVVKHRYLVLASDGFTDLCSTGGGIEKVLKSWAKEMVQVGSPRKETEEVLLKLQERDALKSAETNGSTTAASAASVAPQVGLAIDTSLAALPPTASTSTRPMSPVSPTSPVPFTGNSFSSSMNSLAIPNVDPSYTTAVASSTLPASQPQPTAPVRTPSHKPHRPPLPRTNKSYHCTSSSNMAMRLLRRVLGGEERSNDKVAKALTVNMDVSWIDDTAIVVLGL